MTTTKDRAVVNPKGYATAGSYQSRLTVLPVRSAALILCLERTMDKLSVSKKANKKKQ